MAQLDTRDWLRNAAGRVWVEALDGPRPDAEPTLDQLIDESAAALAGQAPPAAPVQQPQPGGERPAADSPPSLRARIAGALLAVGVIALFVLIVAGSHGTPRAAPAPRSAPATAQPTTAPPSPTTQAVRMLVAYWAPDGQAVPEPVAEREAYHFVGRQGSDWAQVRLPGGGLVWVRLADLHPDQTDLEALARVPDLTPPTPAPPPPIVYVAPPAQEAAPPTPALPPMRFVTDAPEPLPTPRRADEKPVDKPPPGTRAYGRMSPLQPPAAIDQPHFGGMPTEAPAPTGRMP